MSKQTSSTRPIPSPPRDALSASPGLWLRWLKIAWLAFWAALATVLVFPPLTLVALFSRTGNEMFHLARWWAGLLLTVTGVRVIVRGKDKLDSSRAYMIVANHQSHFDGPALAWGLGGLQFRWIAKQELLAIPLFGHCLNSSRHIFIDRTNRQTAMTSIEEGMRRLPPGTSVMCFAEGTRSSTGRIGIFKKGGFAAALQHGMPILPVTINGSRAVLPKDSICFRKGTIEVIISDPVETAAKLYHDLDEVVLETRRVIQASHRSSS